MSRYSDFIVLIRGPGDTVVPPPPTICIELEDGSGVLELEDGSGCLLTEESGTVTSNALLLQDDSFLLLQDGSSHLLLNS